MIKNRRADTEDEKSSVFLKAIKNSVIVRALSKFAAKIYNAVAVSVFGNILASRDKTESKFDSSLSKNLSHDGEKSVERSKKIKYAFAKRIEQSALLNIAKRARAKLMCISLTSYGVLLFSFGFYATIIYAIKYFALTLYTAPRVDLFVSLCAIVFSLFLFASKRSMADALSTSKIIRTVFADMLGFRTESIDKYAEAPVEQYVGIPFIIGTVLGLTSFFVHPHYVLLAAALVIFVHLILALPEAGLLTVIVALPFIKTTYIVVIIALTFVSYAIKFLCGRRVPKFTGIDIPVIMFMLLLLSGGFFSLGDGSLPSALVYICFMMGYFLVKWMFGSQKYVSRAIYAVALSATIVSLWGILEYFIGSPSNATLDVSLFGNISGRVTSSFTNPNMLAEFLIMAAPVTVALAAASQSKRMRFALMISAALDLVCLVLTWSRGAWLGIIIAGISALFIAGKNWLTAAVISLPAGAAAFICIDSNITSRLLSVGNFSDSSTAYRINIWKSTVKLIDDHFLYGIGVGEGAFTSVFPYYALPGLTNVPHSHSLYLQIITETGIFSLLIFLAIVFMFIQSGFSFVKTSRLSKNRYIALGIMCAVTALLIQGFTDHVFYNYKICLMFWLLIGLLFAHISAAQDSSDEVPSEY